MTTAPSRAQHATRLLALYRRTLSPVLAASGLGHCRYLPTCSEFAAVAVARHGWFRGSALALARLARCHPWARGGLDPVPPIIQAPVPPAPPGAPSSVPRPPAHLSSHRHHLP